MGVPAFYRWLVQKYPKIVQTAVNESSVIVDPAGPNPNGFEFDNLYLDMNGIIHPCFHPDHHKDFQPTTFSDVFSSIFDYIDRLFDIARPRKVLYLAIDGVAPRAKMNQQRARRFQNAKNNKDAEEEEERLRIQYEREGKKVLPKVESQLDDSNIITPGTEFMDDLSKALQGYIRIRLCENAAWKDVKVILSDSNAPGEGEHKIMSFIRSQRCQPDYDVNTRHCLYGLDADLIMLALATHELHFSILREDILTVMEPQLVRSTEPRNGGSEGGLSSFPVKKTCPYQFIHIWILREYLELDMQPSEAPDGFKFDLERAVDDFIFMCFFVGNDFLPHIPSLEIHEGAIDLLMSIYKRDFKNSGGYLVDTKRVGEPNTSYVNLKRVEKLILALGSYEEKIFQKRNDLRERRMRRMLRDLSLSKNEEVVDEVEDLDDAIVSIPIVSLDTNNPSLDCADIVENTEKLKEELRSILKERSDVFKNGLSSAEKIKYGTAGWKERYYLEKFPAKDQSSEGIKKAIVKEYTEGLCWVLLYYFSGVPSWTWFYPYQYGPCASDMRGLAQIRVRFQEGLPFEPFDQLMAVLPPRSVEALPRAYRSLMTDESSDIASFYPKEFEVDIDGKRYLWQGVCILPFIDEVRLLSATRKAKEDLKIYEVERNSVKADLLFVRACSDFGLKLLIKLDEKPSNGSNGFVNLDLHSLDPSVEENRILCVSFKLPKSVHIPRVLANVNIPEKTVYESDIGETQLWHEHQGSFQGRRNPSDMNWRRKTPTVEKDTVVGGSGCRGRGGFRGAAPHSSNSRQGNYHPTFGCNESNYRAPFRAGGNHIPHANQPAFRVPVGDHTFRGAAPQSNNLRHPTFGCNQSNYGAPFRAGGNHIPHANQPAFRMPVGDHTFRGAAPHSNNLRHPTFGCNQSNYGAPFRAGGNHIPHANQPVFRMPVGDHSHPRWPGSYGNPRPSIPVQRGFTPRASGPNFGSGRLAHESSFGSPRPSFASAARGEDRSSSMVGTMEMLSMSTDEPEESWITVKSRRGRGRGRGQV